MLASYNDKSKPYMLERNDQRKFNVENQKLDRREKSDNEFLKGTFYFVLFSNYHLLGARHESL